MAPDKIYLQHNTTTDLYDEFWPEWFEGTHHPERDICYIRKDALLAFLNERGKGLSSGDSFVAGERKMLKEIIKKIESL